MKSFYNVEDYNSKSQWEDLEEQTFHKYKQDINNDRHHIYKIDDIGVYSQLLLDYLEHLRAPLISQHSIEKLEAIVDKHKRGEDLDKTEVLLEVKFNKNEFALLNRFRVFLMEFTCGGPEMMGAVLRIGITLLGLKAEMSKRSFKGRYMILERAYENKQLQRFAKLFHYWLGDTNNSVSKSVLVKKY